MDGRRLMDRADQSKAQLNLLREYEQIHPYTYIHKGGAIDKQ